ncbi:hypothetical protein GOBAR_DD36342 [Gossypium barbadense]|nr:hypothetical protein GOBAR_DD36342 [Gossypium barbadense]
MYSPGGILNSLATALHGSIRTVPSIHRLRLGLLGYLIPFVPQLSSLSVSVGPAECFYRWSLGFDGGLKKPPTDALRPIILDNACIFCITAATGTELADAYSPDTVIASSPGKEDSGPCLNPSVADHPLGSATDHRLGKLLPHQLANQTRAPPRADSSFCSSAYRVLVAVSNCCSPPKGRIELSMGFIFALLIASMFVDKAGSELSFIPRHNLSLGRVSVPVWLIILSDQLLIIALPFPAVVPLPRAGSYALLTRPPLETPLPVRLACVKHAASVHPEPGSNSP